MTFKCESVLILTLMIFYKGQISATVEFLLGRTNCKNNQFVQMFERSQKISFVILFYLTMFCNTHRELIKIGTFVGYSLITYKAIQNLMWKDIERSNKPNNTRKERNKSRSESTASGYVRLYSHSSALSKRKHANIIMTILGMG